MAKKLKLGIDLINAIKELVSGLPTNGVIGYDSNDTIPGGYEETNVDFLDYSTTETIVGRWINNKSIYRRVFNIGSVSTGSSSVLGTISNLDDVISMFGACNSNGLWLPIPRTHASDVIYQNHIYIENGSVKIGCGFGSAISYGYLIIEYTKTTD